MPCATAAGADRRHHGAHRTGRRAFRRFGLLAAAVLPEPGNPGRAAAPDRDDGQGPQCGRPDECPVRHPEECAGCGEDVVYVLEVNPRASRTVPFVSKATSLPLAKIAARCMAGRSLADQGVTREIIPPYFSVKEAVFPFIKFPGVDTILGSRNEIDRGGHGRRPHVRRGLRQVAVRRRDAPAESPARSSSASSRPTGPRQSRSHANCTNSVFPWSPRAAPAARSRRRAFRSAW
jgi:hypothetical protein